MKASTFIPVFTPSQLPPEELEKIFVQRHELLRDAEARVKESATSGNKHHLLFVGPRGSGKTHFVSLLVHRLDSDPELQSVLDIAWLNEDETCTGFLDLLIKIYEALAKRDLERFAADRIEPLYEMKSTEGERFLGRVLLDQVGGRTPLIVVENLDLLFQSIGDEGQKKLRAYLQEHAVFSIVATAQALVGDLTDRNVPFFGFFQTEHLKPLSLEDADELLRKIAARNQDKELTDFLATAKGRSRIRALHFLSGGNHRVFIVLSQFINRENIDQLVEPFRKMVDELTPYYQERVRALPPLQRKIVEFLCKSVETVPVKEIAKRMLTSHQTVSKQLQELRGKRYVRSFTQGRESLYEVSEPLMRICVEVKENQNYGPLRLLVDFIRVWHESDELTKRKAVAADGTLEAIYYGAACERMAAEGNLYYRGITWGYQDDAAKAIADYTAVVELDGAPVDYVAKSLFNRGVSWGKQGDAAKAIADYTAVVELGGAPVDQVAIALNNRGVAWGRQGDAAKEIADYTAVVELDGAPVDQLAKALYNRGVTWAQQGESGKAITDFTAVVELDGASVHQVAMALNDRGVAWGQQGESEKSIADFSAVVELDDAPVDQIANALYNRGVAWGQIGEFGKAIADYTAVVELNGAPPDQVVMALHNRGFRWSQQGELGKAIADYTAVVELDGATVNQVAKALFNRGTQHSLRHEFKSAEADFKRVCAFEELPSEWRADCHRGFAELRGREGRWNESFKALRAALEAGRQAAPRYICDLEELLDILFQSGLSAEILATFVGEFLRTAKDEEVLVHLGESLVRHLGEFAKPEAKSTPLWLKRWAEVWREEAAGVPELEISLRMFGCGVDFLCSPDRNESILHRLKSEERLLLRKTLRLDKTNE